MITILNCQYIIWYIESHECIVRTVDIVGGELKSTKVKTETVSQSVSQCYPWDVPGGSHHHHYHHHCQSSQAWALTNLTSCGDWRYPATSLGKVILTATITSLSPSLHNYLPFLSLSHVIWRNWQWGRRELGLTVSLHFALIMKMKVHSCTYGRWKYLHSRYDHDHCFGQSTYIGHWQNNVNPFILYTVRMIIRVRCLASLLWIWIPDCFHDSSPCLSLSCIWKLFQLFWW